MRFAVLASGSSANCTFLESAKTRILIDCGLSAKRTSERLFGLGIDPASIDAILLTHEHADHVRGLSVFTRKYKVPVYAVPGVISELGDIYQCCEYSSGAFEFKDLLIEPVSIPHDAQDPHAFVISDAMFRLAHVTDLGKVTKLVRESIRAVNALVLESNHDEQLLMQCSYSWALKQRIKSTQGHLSNLQAVELAREIFHGDLYALVLAHLSENSNRPELALNTFKQGLKSRLDSAHSQFKLVCAPRHFATELFDLKQMAVGEYIGKSACVGI
jgi:phosphoribosyl 1,2-cyclic phosphodiesterase